MELKIKNKNKNKKWFVITSFFVLLQISQANIALSASITAEEMISLTNRSRAEAGLHLLLVNEKLTEAAKKKADDMFEFQYFDHNGPNGSTPWDFIRSVGYDYIYAGENLAIDFVTANGAHKALMGSSSHRENILNSNYTEIGIVAIEGIFEGNISIIIVEEFGAPLGKTANVDHSLNENIELALEEKVDEINSLKDEKEKELEEFSQTGLPAGQADFAQDYPSDKQEHEANGLEEESIVEQDDDLLMYNLETKCHSDQPAGGEEWFDKLTMAPCYFGTVCYPESVEWQSDLESTYYLQSNLDENNFRNKFVAKDEEKNSEDVIGYNPILLAGSLDNERVMGLVNKAYAKDEHIKKYNYQQESIGLAMDRYLQNDLISRIFLFCAILATLLISDFTFLVCYYSGRDLNRTC